MTPPPALPLPPGIARELAGFSLAEDGEGMSPTRVFRCTRGETTLYLKVSDARFDGTTYDVARERDVMAWLSGRLAVPEVVAFERHGDRSHLLMTAMPGESLARRLGASPDPFDAAERLAEAVLLLGSVPVAECPFDAGLDVRLRELDRLLAAGLADVDAEHWEEDTPFEEPRDLYDYLVAHRPAERPAFTHGDLCDGNLFILPDGGIGFIDLGRGGAADPWGDIAFCVREIRGLTDDPAPLDRFFRRIGREPDPERLRYFILLDEMF